MTGVSVGLILTPDDLYFTTCDEQQSTWTAGAGIPWHGPLAAVRLGEWGPTIQSSHPAPLRSLAAALAEAADKLDAAMSRQAVKP